MGASRLHSATITLKFQSTTDARNVLAAISPDNAPLPEGLRIECSEKNGELRILIECDRAIASLGATIEDLMSAVDLAIRTSDSVEPQES